MGQLLITVQVAHQDTFSLTMVYVYHQACAIVGLTSLLMYVLHIATLFVQHLLIMSIQINLVTLLAILLWFKVYFLTQHFFVIVLVVAIQLTYIGMRHAQVFAIVLCLL